MPAWNKGNPLPAEGGSILPGICGMSVIVGCRLSGSAVCCDAEYAPWPPLQP